MHDINNKVDRRSNSIKSKNLIFIKKKERMFFVIIILMHYKLVYTI